MLKKILIVLYILYIFSAVEHALASDLSSTNFALSKISFSGGGGAMSSSNFIAGSTALGEDTAGVMTLNSSSFISQNGQVAVLNDLPSQVPKRRLIANLLARSDVLGTAISESDWQKDTDPYFSWSLETGVEPNLIAGYAVALDTLPGSEITTENLFYQVPENFLISGKHTFYVLPITVDGQAETDSMLQFELWVDVDYPLISQLSPLSGVLITDNKTPVSCSVYDKDSGFDQTTTTLNINNNTSAFDYDPNTQLLIHQPTALAEGKNNVLLKAYDLAGNYVVKAWDFIVDTQIPFGGIMINNGETTTHSAVVFINVEAEDIISGVAEIYLSNDGIFDTELEKPYSYAPVIYDWVLAEPDIDGVKTVFTKFKDAGGNLSGTYKAQITLKLLTPQTRIISGPASTTESSEAEFKFESSKPGSLFSYKIDEQNWSAWSASGETSFSGLSDGNHYFYAKAAFDLNGDGSITVDEEDPTPAQWVWTIRPETEAQKAKRKILFWKR